jgi:hypothetical protein
LVSVLAVTWLGSADSARAEDRDDDGREDGAGSFMLALDLDYAGAIDYGDVEGGGGVGVRVGSELDLFLVSLIPELSVDYHSFGGSGGPNVVTGKLGGRLRFLKIVEPGIFAHVGVGHVGGVADYTGVALDAGVTLDFTLLPLIDLGVHAAWNSVVLGGDDEGFSYATLGGHVALVL